MLSMVAMARGWDVWQPASLETGFDLSTRDGQGKCWTYLEEIQPDAVAFAFPCDPWTQMQNVNQRTEKQRDDLQKRRIKHRNITRFVREVAKWQHERGAIFYTEQPATAQSLKLPEIRDVAELCNTGITDMCMYQLRCPETNAHLRKRTWLCSNSSGVMRKACTKCDTQHSHKTIEGSVRLPSGRRVRLSAFAGGYTRPFSEAVITGMVMDLPTSLRRGPWRAGEEKEAYPASIKRKDTDMDAEERAVLTPLWQRRQMQKVDAPTRKRRVGFNEAPERESNDVPSAPRRRLRRKTPTIPPRSEAVRQEIEAIGPLAPPPTPPPPVEERSGRKIPTRLGFRRKWKSDKRWGGAGGYWQWEPISKGKRRQHPPAGIEEQRASSSNEGALPSPKGPPVALRPDDGPEDGPASNFPPQPESAQVPSPDPVGPGEPERQEDEGAAHEGVLPNPENEQPREDGQDRDEAASLFGEWDHRDGQDE